MFWNLIILLFGIISALYAIPYGNWEYKNGAKFGAVVIYILSFIGIGVSTAQIFF